MKTLAIIVFIIIGLGFLYTGILGLLNGNVSLIGGRTPHSGFIGGNASVLISIGFICIGLNFLLSILDLLKNRKSYGDPFLILIGLSALIIGAIVFAFKI